MPENQIIPHSISLTRSLSRSYRSFDVDNKSIYSQASSLHIREDELDEEEEKAILAEEEAKKHRPCCRCCKCCVNCFKGIGAINATNLSFNPFDPGYWDEWGVYYCSSRFGRHTKFNAKYFSIAAIIVLGQSNFFSLISLMQENGGLAFLFVLFLTYISFGYLTYLLETLMGQYTGRKPIMMIRLLAPIFSGLGVALYIRTLFRAVILIGSFANCLYHFFDLLLCKTENNSALQRMIFRERDQETFLPFYGLTHPLLNWQTDAEFHFDKLLLVICGGCLWVSFGKLKEFGSGMTVIMRMLLLFLAGYSFIGYSRMNPTVSAKNRKSVSWDSLAYLPLRLALETNWWKLLDGNAWMRAMIYVMHSLELGTLVHPYLGSKCFFHYRCSRDGIFLVLVSFTWNLLGVVGVLLWLGYVGINEKEIRNSMKEIDGYYGMFVIFPLKHVQAEMTLEVESDILFYCGVLYLIIGISALLASICYLYIITDCSFPESGHAVIKFFVLCFYIIFLGLFIFPLMSSDDGVRHLIFLEYYGYDSWTGLFLIICFMVAVTGSHGMARVLHDFYNMIHLKGYKVMTHYHQIPIIVVLLFTGYPFFALLLKTLARRNLIQGPAKWYHPATVAVGYFFNCMPTLAILFGAFYHLRRKKYTLEPSFKPHRDFYKNKHHICVCFKDYQHFDAEKLPESVQIISAPILRQNPSMAEAEAED